ncbi:MAG TPA: hypothetical protein ENJ28_06555 [Gammaproteobacteria bacterium]|nr:hypothetical protein [Gammaproteobacteria bacterium]
MKKLHKIIAATLLASAATTGSSVVLAESALTANVGMTSNYIWRGATQTKDSSAISGGIDYAHASGAYVGIWTSNVSWTTTAPGYEQDIYAGYAFDAGPVGLDVGYISYGYPLSTVDDFSEIYVNATFKNFNAGIANDSKNKSTYISAGAEFEVKKDLTLAVTFGSFDYSGSANDYAHTQLSLSKGDFTFAYDDTDQSGAAGKPRLSVSWSQSFDL